MALEDFLKRLDRLIPAFGKWRWLRHQKIGKGCRISSGVIWQSCAAGSLLIGERCEIEAGVVFVPAGGWIVLGNDCYVGYHTVLHGHGGLHIGSNVLIAPHCVIIPSNHNYDRTDIPIRHQGETMQGIHIEDDVWLASGVRVLDGVRIGEGSVVGAGAVVTRSLPPYCIAAGVPAQVIRYRR